MILFQQLSRCFFAYPFYTGDIIHCIAHQSQNIYHLAYIGDIPFFTNFFRPHYFYRAALVAGFINFYIFRNQLPVIFIGRNHKNFVARFFCLLCQRTNYIISFVTIFFYTGNIEAFYNSFNIGQRRQNIFRSLLPVGFIICKIGMALCRCMGIKTYCHVRWLLVIDEFN